MRSIKRILIVLYISVAVALVIGIYSNKSIHDQQKDIYSCGFDFAKNRLEKAIRRERCYMISSIGSESRGKPFIVHLNRVLDGLQALPKVELDRLYKRLYIGNFDRFATLLDVESLDISPFLHDSIVTPQTHNDSVLCAALAIRHALTVNKKMNDGYFGCVISDFEIEVSGMKSHYNIDDSLSAKVFLSTGFAYCSTDDFLNIRINEGNYKKANFADTIFYKVPADAQADLVKVELQITKKGDTSNVQEMVGLD